MPEGNVYICTWSQDQTGFTIALKRDPKIQTIGETLAEAEEQMWDLLCEIFGDGEAVLQYEKPPPVAEQKFASRYGTPHLVTVSGNESTGKLLNAPELHPRGYCRRCERPLETTPGILPQFDWLPSCDGAVSQNLNPIFSSEFLALLTDKERSSLLFEPVLGPKRQRKKFFQLAGQPKADFVAVPEFEGLLNFHCQGCQRPMEICYLRNCALFRFIALLDLPNPIPDVFTIGSDGQLNLCMRQERFSQILGQRGARKITSSRLWVVADSKFVRQVDEQNHPLQSPWMAGRSFPDLR